MKWFKSRKIRSKLMLVFTLMLLITAVVLLQIITTVLALQQDIYTLENEALVRQQIVDAQAIFSDQQTAAYKFLLTGDPADQEFYSFNSDQLVRFIDDAQADFRLLDEEVEFYDTERYRTLTENWNHVDQLRQNYDAGWQAVIIDYQAGNEFDISETEHTAANIQEQLSSMLNQTDTRAAAVVSQSAERSGKIINTAIYAFVLLFLMSILAIVIVNNITEPVAGLSNAIVAFENDFYKEKMVTPYVDRSDEFGQLVRFFNMMASSISVAAETQLHFLNAAQRFIPHQYLEFLEKDSITEVKLGDHISAEMAVMFSDIRGFTTMSEQMTPQQNFDFVNEYLRLISPIIQQHDGFIVKFLGDGMMAIFPYGVNDAVRAGIEKQQRIIMFNEKIKEQGYPPIEVGIGIHTGKMMVGMIGEELRLQGDAFSDNVNLTARIEGLTKFFGVSLIISEEGYAQLPQPLPYRVRFLGQVIVKGRVQALGLYEIFDGAVESVRQLKEMAQPDFRAGFEHYAAARFKQAIPYFEKVLAILPDDQITQHYLEKAVQLQAKGTPENWSSVEKMTTK